MARTLLQQKQTAINALKDKLLKIDAAKNPDKYARAAAMLRRLEKTLPKPVAEVEQKESTLVSGMTGAQHRLIFEVENALRGGEAKANNSQEAWLNETFAGEDTRTDQAERAEMIERLRKNKA
jgi:hypothetical protein